MKNTLNRKDLGIYVWTSDKNMKCVPAWAYLFNKFWPYKAAVRVLGYSKPQFSLPDNFEFISLGTQRGPKFWSEDMLGFYESCDHEYFYAMWEDGFIIDYVDQEILDMAIKIAFTNKEDKFFRFNLSLDTHRRPHKTIKVYDRYDLILASQTSRYRQSTQHSIWSKDKFLKKMKVNQSPWDFELDDINARNDGLMIFATKRLYAIKMGHGYRQGKKIPFWYDEHSGYRDIAPGTGASLSEEDIHFIESNGWIPQDL
ncbi:MAG TPA: hypothetical protein EYN67_08765 [Flavobacteriales bacterium]|nr:hypothetical protein [Flavobacteriales bacterium]